MDERKTCRIKSQKDNLSLYEKEDWDEMIAFMADVAERMEKALRNPVNQLNRHAKKGDL